MKLTAYEMGKIHNAFLKNKIYTFDDINNDIGDIVDEIHTDRNLEKYTIFTNRRKIVMIINAINNRVTGDNTQGFNILRNFLFPVFNRKYGVISPF